MVNCVDINGNTVLLVDPEGVYMIKGKSAPDFRIFGQQRMKSFGCRLVQCYDGHDLDVLECKYTGIIVPLKTENGILVLSTKKNDLKVKSVILKDIMTKRHSALICPNQITSTNNTSTSMTMNVAKLDEVQLARLWHCRV